MGASVTSTPDAPADHQDKCNSVEAPHDVDGQATPTPAIGEEDIVLNDDGLAPVVDLGTREVRNCF